MFNRPPIASSETVGYVPTTLPVGQQVAIYFQRRDHNAEIYDVLATALNVIKQFFEGSLVTDYWTDFDRINYFNDKAACFSQLAREYPENAELYVAVSAAVCRIAECFRVSFPESEIYLQELRDTLVKFPYDVLYWEGFPTTWFLRILKGELFPEERLPLVAEVEHLPNILTDGLSPVTSLTSVLSLPTNVKGDFEFLTTGGEPLIQRSLIILCQQLGAAEPVEKIRIVQEIIDLIDRTIPSDYATFEDDVINYFIENNVLFGLNFRRKPEDIETSVRSSLRSMRDAVVAFIADVASLSIDSDNFAVDFYRNLDGILKSFRFLPSQKAEIRRGLSVPDENAAF